MTRITNAIRDAIVANAVKKSGIEEVIKSIELKRDEWNERARIAALGGKEKADRYAAINAEAKRLHDQLPREIQEYDRIAKRSSYFSLNLAGANIQVRMKYWSEVPINRPALTADNPLVQEFYDLEDSAKDALSKKKSIEQQVRASISKFTTINRLLDAWPEAKELIPSSAPEARDQLPAIPVADLNSMIGLPSLE